MEFEDYNPDEGDIETSVNPKFVLELAAGIEPPEAVCQRYEVTKREYEHLKTQDYFIKLLAETAIQITASGKSLQLAKQLYLTHGLQRIHRIISTETDNEVVLKAWDRLIEFERPKGAKPASTDDIKVAPFQLIAQDPDTFDVASDDEMDTSELPFDEFPEDYDVSG